MTAPPALRLHRPLAHETDTVQREKYPHFFLLGDGRFQETLRRRERAVDENVAARALNFRDYLQESTSARPRLPQESTAANHLQQAAAGIVRRLLISRLKVRFLPRSPFFSMIYRENARTEALLTRY